MNDGKVVLEVTDEQQKEMSNLLLEFGERHDLSEAELVYCVVTALTYHGYMMGLKEKA